MTQTQCKQTGAAAEQRVLRASAPVKDFLPLSVSRFDLVWLSA